MPNWCNNTLTITGEVGDLIKIRDEFKGQDGEPLLFNNTYPVKDDEDATTCWGTRTELDTNTGYVESIEGDDLKLTYSFDTAWSPPCGWLEQVVTEHPELGFEMYYAEGGIGFWGVASGSEGEFDDSRLTHDEYLIDVDEFYEDYVKEINCMTQEDLIKSFSSSESFSACCQEEEEWPEGVSDGWGSDMWDYCSLAGYIIPRIEVMNLPLFINVDWGSDNYNQMFMNRLKEATNG